MANLISLNFQNDSIRTYIQDEDYYFCLADICKILNLKNPSHTANQIKQEFSCPTLHVGQVEDPSGRKSATFITEPQLYYIMNRSNAKNAHKFRMWVNCEVLPAIRKHGAYIAPHKEDDKSFIETFKNFCLQHNYSAREVEMFNWFGEMKLKQGYAIAMSKVEKESSEKEPANSDNKDGVFLPIHVAERLLDAVKWHRKNEQHMLDVIRALRNAAHIALQELPVIELYAERDGVMFDRLYWYLKELDQEQKQLENKA